MVPNKGRHGHSDDEDDIVNAAENVSIENMVRMCDKLIEALQQRAFVAEQDIMSICSKTC
ncbi:hypothetical protein M514_08862 [Trichuris suis]|uniref:Uncharacterized protein n=1 Tax=Trichuris suis TaxID=68888 RepID=A0A085LZ38_9BILA|nr:hypothetical protein M513_08862 [Trichuris suis]KFD60314.1 hypothetical protein M514_08862 [Trichuris suis]